jgi:hypothetical protein
MTAAGLIRSARGARLLALSLLAVAALAAAPAASVAASAPEAARTVRACLQHSDRLLVDVMIDSSGSLAGSDPEDRRVDGVRAALIGLAELADKRHEDERAPRVEALLSSFAGSVQPRDPAASWRQLDGDSLARLEAEAELYGERDHGRDTDYVLALSAARAALREQAEAVVEAGGEQPCQVILFLSDGGYRIADRSGAEHLPASVFYAPAADLETPAGAAAAMAAGRRLLCDPGQLMDGLVDDGVVLFTVALTGSELSVRDRDRLAALTVGEAGEERCGSRLSPETGEFIEAQDSLELFSIFLGLFEPSVVGTENPSEFRIEPGLSGFTLATAALRPGLELELTGPSGETASFANGGPEEVPLSGATVHQRWLESRSMEVRARIDDGEAAAGIWGFQFHAPPGASVPAYYLSFRSGLRPSIASAPPLVLGVTTTVPVRLLDGDGTPASGPLARSARLRAQVVDGTGAARPAEARPTGPGKFEVPIAVPDEVADGAWKLEAEAFFPAEKRAIQGDLVSLDLGAPRLPQPPEPPWKEIVAGLLLALFVALLIWRRRSAGLARFTAPQRLRAFECEALVVPGSAVELTPDPGLLDYNDFKPLKRRGAEEKAALIERDPFSFRARAPWRPRARPVGEATAKDRLLLGGRKDGPLPGAPDHSSCELSLEPAGTWLFALEPLEADDEARGRLLILTEEDAPVGLGAEVLEAACQALLEQDWDEFKREAADDEDNGRFPDIDDEIGWESVSI